MGEKAISACAFGVGALASMIVLISLVRAPTTLEERRLHVYGTRILDSAGFTERTADGQLPIAALYAFAGRTLAGARPVEGSIRAARALTWLLWMLLCVVVWRWGYELYGPHGALGGLVLTAFFPPLLAHASLMTPDVPAVATMTLALYLLSRCLWDPTLQRAGAAGVVIGLALLTKHGTTVLLPIFLLLVVLRVITAERMEPRGRVAHGALVATLLAWLVALLVLNAGFAFERSGTTAAWLHGHSALFRAAQTIFGSLILPAPYAYLESLDLVLAPRAMVEGFAYVFGDRSTSTVGPQLCWVALAVLVALSVSRRWRRERRYSDGVLLVPIAWLGLGFGLLFHPQIGVRYGLLLSPFLALLAAGVWDHARDRRAQQLPALLVLLVSAASAAAALRAAW